MFVRNVMDIKYVVEKPSCNTYEVSRGLNHLRWYLFIHYLCVCLISRAFVACSSV